MILQSNLIILLFLIINLTYSFQLPFFSNLITSTSSSLSSTTKSNEELTIIKQPKQQTTINFATLKLKSSIHLSTKNRNLPPLHLNYSNKELNLLKLNEIHLNIQSELIKTIKKKVFKPNSNKLFQSARFLNYIQSRPIITSSTSFNKKLKPLTSEELIQIEEGKKLEWEEIELQVPDIKSIETISSLAKMTSNAYSSPDRINDWYTLDGKWNVSDSFGWLEDGLRGHIFSDETNSTVVIAIKGTSATFIGGSSTSRNDKFNDNLLFSCCCARVDWTWSTVCDCYGGGWNCGQNCIEDAVMNESNYYPIATDLYNNITALYPTAQIWLVGHSLGGALASMLSLTYGVPSVSFEAPGDLIPAKRLHLPMPPGATRYGQDGVTTHVYHTADPIPQGVCTGPLSTCAVAGFALETKCHTGLTILYDTVGRLGWSVDIRTHTIRGIIDNLLIQDWSVKKDKNKKKEEKFSLFSSSGSGGGIRKGWGWWPGKGGGGGDDDDPDEEEPDDGQNGGRGVPEARREVDCIDCFRWEFV